MNRILSGCVIASFYFPPFGDVQFLAVLRTNPDGAGIVQTLGPLKTLASKAPSADHSRRFLIITEINEPTHVLLQQADSEGTSAAVR